MVRRRGPITDPSTISGQHRIAVEDDEDDEEISAAEVEDNSLRNLYAGDTRVGSTFQSNQGTLTTLPNVPIPGDIDDSGVGGMVVKDPQNPKRLVRIGGYHEGPRTWVYDTELSAWLEDEYPDPTNDWPGVFEDSSYNRAAHSTVGSYIVLAGGSVGGDRTGDIYTLDTSEDDPIWQNPAEIPAEVSYSGYFSYDGDIYILGGMDKDLNITEGVFRFDPEEGEVEHIYDLGFGLDNSGNCPVIDSHAYIWGDIEGELDGDELDSTSFLRLDINTGDVERLADIDVLLYEGEEEGDDGLFGAQRGDMYEYEGNLVFIDGYNWFNKQDIAYYSVERDEWTGRGAVSYDADDYDTDEVPFRGADKGEMIDGVFYFPGTGASPETLWAYIPEKEPFNN